MSILVILTRCVTEFVPVTKENQELLVVEALITNKPEAYTIKLSRSLPLGERLTSNPQKGASVTITDDNGGVYTTTETTPGSYSTDPSVFIGETGRKYALHITLTEIGGVPKHYESLPVEMTVVPAIDSLYYEKVSLSHLAGYTPNDGAQVYLDTHSADNSCKYYRWEFVETWEFHLPYMVPNNICWISNSSSLINVKSTAAIAEDKIMRYPLNFISNETDRLSIKYSILVNQYSLNEDEFNYWDKFKNISEQVGGLYDITPSSVPTNIWCTDDPSERVLGYFSVSACSSKRLFIKSNFRGLINLYSNCIADTIWTPGPIPHLGTSIWVIIEHTIPPPSYRVTTYEKGCYDCTVRGTNDEPSYWRLQK